MVKRHKYGKLICDNAMKTSKKGCIYNKENWQGLASSLKKLNLGKHIEQSAA